jgi:hypothetical protein
MKCLSGKRIISQQRAVERALTNKLSLNNRFERQLSGNVDMYRKVASATAVYTRAIREHGTNTLVGVKAAGEYRRELVNVNSSIVSQAGLLVTPRQQHLATQKTLQGVAASAARLSKYGEV